MSGASLLRDVFLAALAVILIRAAAGFHLELAWWRELGHETAFWRMIQVQWIPPLAATAAAFLVLAGSFHAARRRSLTRMSQSFAFSAAGTALAAAGAAFLSFAAIDPWTAALWWSAKEVGGYADPLFGHGLAFYFYTLPFYRMVLDWAGSVAVLAFAGYAATLLISSATVVLLPNPETPMSVTEAPPRVLASLAKAARGAMAVLLVLFAAGRWLGRYDLLYASHRFLYGADFVDTRLGVPLLWAQLALALIMAVAVLSAPKSRFLVQENLGLQDAALGALPGRLSLFLVIAGAAGLLLPAVIQGAVRSLWVRPNELTLERPYIEHHISATLAAFNLAENTREEPFSPRAAKTMDLAKDPGVAENIRLWDWEPFRDNVTQRQTLRPYYAFPEVDTDRYMIGGRTR